MKLLCAHVDKNKQMHVTQMTVLNHQRLTHVSINSVSAPRQVGWKWYCSCWGSANKQCCKQWSGPVPVWERSVRGLFHTGPALNSDTLLQRLGWVWSPNVSTTKPSLTQVLLWQGSVLWKERLEGFSQQRAWRQAEPSVSVLFLSEVLMYILKILDDSSGTGSL